MKKYLIKCSECRRLMSLNKIRDKEIYECNKCSKVAIIDINEEGHRSLERYDSNSYGECKISGEVGELGPNGYSLYYEYLFSKTD